MDVQKITSGVTAAAVVGTGAFVGGNHVIDQNTGGPQKREDAQIERIRPVSYTHLTLPTSDLV